MDYFYNSRNYQSYDRFSPLFSGTVALLLKIQPSLKYLVDISSQILYRGLNYHLI